jgi:hypothetical protein
MEYRNSLTDIRPCLVSITRRDLGQSFECNLDTSEYTSAPYPPKLPTEEEIERRGLLKDEGKFAYLGRNPGGRDFQADVSLA